jgi:signal transduction histidine kinase
MSRAGVRPLYLFIGLVIVCQAQIAWWTYFLIRETTRSLATQLLSAERDRHLAELWLQRELNPTGQTPPSRAQVEAFLASHFPNLKLQPGEPAKIDIAPAFAAESAHEGRHAVIMFVSEGAFFLIVMLGGVYLIYRALRRESELKRQQSDFVAAASHELKTPVAALKLAVQTLARPDLPRDKQARFLDNMVQDLARLELLLQMILKAGQIESGRFALHPEEVDLAAELERHAARAEPLLKEQNCELQAALEPGLRVRADRQALESILSNLIDNAAKYVQDGVHGRINLRLRRGGERAIIEVEDNGIGIERRELAHVFERFFRGTRESVRTRPGTGLGLYVVKELVEEQGGTIEAESAGLGRGTTFRVSFPAVEEPHGAGAHSGRGR